MPRVELDVEDVVRTGLDPTYSAAEADGNNWKNPNSNTFCHVKNGSASSVTVTIDATKTVSGLNVADLTVAVPASEERIIGPFPRETFNQGDGTVHIDYSASADVTIGVFRLD
jgi:hypothetical protein